MTPTERFWGSVYKTNHCWFWVGCTKRNYGTIVVSGKHIQAHRFSWRLHFGEIPDGLLVCHKCDTRNCVRPEHLFLGTVRDNNRDAMNKGYGALIFNNTDRQNLDDRRVGTFLKGAKEKKWRAVVKRGGKRYQLGSFYTKEDANEAYKNFIEYRNFLETIPRKVS